MGFTYDMLEAFLTQGPGAVPAEVATRIARLQAASGHKRRTPPTVE